MFTDKKMAFIQNIICVYFLMLSFLFSIVKLFEAWGAWSASSTEAITLIPSQPHEFGKLILVFWSLLDIHCLSLKELNQFLHP